jgi:hypothetical protein
LYRSVGLALPMNERVWGLRGLVQASARRLIRGFLSTVTFLKVVWQFVSVGIAEYRAKNRVDVGAT